jgi:ribose/xylose/arabinose/galactoside ABC-type transport system permease subunit
MEIAYIDKSLKTSLIKRIASRNLFILIILVVALFVFFSVFTKNFFTMENFPMILLNMAINGTLAIGMTFCILTTGIDLSVGSVLGLSAVIAATANKAGANWIVSLFIAILVGIVCGIVTGSLVSVFKIPAFISSLGTQSIALGIALTITSGTPISSALTQIKPIGTQRLFGFFPYTWIIMLLCFIIAHFILQYTRMGRYMYTIGGNAEAARFSGIKMRVYTAIPFVLSGILAAIAALSLISRTSSADAVAGQSMELDAVAATIIGGTSMRGGEGTMIGTFVGALLMAILKNGMVQLGLTTYPQKIILGVIIIVVVILDITNKSRN